MLTLTIISASSSWSACRISEMANETSYSLYLLCSTSSKLNGIEGRPLRLIFGNVLIACTRPDHGDDVMERTLKLSSSLENK